LPVVPFDMTIKIWNNNTGALMKTLTGHSNYVRTVAFDLTYLLASGIFEAITIETFLKIEDGRC